MDALFRDVRGLLQQTTLDEFDDREWLLSLLRQPGKQILMCIKPSGLNT